MEIILTTDVKGKGKKGAVINVANGYGNFLIQQNKALAANESNLDVLEEQNKAHAEMLALELQKAKELKEIVDKKTVLINAKAGKDGKIFGTVSTKQIVDIFQNETKIKLDKKKIKSIIPINSLGVYKLEVELHKEVKATLTVQVVDKSEK